MKLAIGTAHSLFVALSSVDRDDKTRLDGKTRIAIAIDINLLQPHVTAYERVRGQRQREIIGEGERVGALQNAALLEADAELREQEIEVTLKAFAVAELKLDDNVRITGAMLAMLAPVLSDLNT
jgi:hypothetical protein